MNQCARCGQFGHLPKDCDWPTNTDDEPVRVPYVPPVLDPSDYDDFLM